MWVKHIWETTLVMYKAALTDWHMGTGGGSGLDIEFEKWDEDKFDRYKINPEDYDHTDVSQRPLVLFDMYTKAKEPFLTVIRLWDNMSDNILCAKYDPLNIGEGEAGMECSTLGSVDSSTIATTPSSSRKRKNTNDPPVGIQDVMKSMTDLCHTYKSSISKVEKEKNTNKKETGVDSMSLKDLYEAIDQYKKHILFLKEMDMCSEEEKCDIVGKIKELFAEINSRTSSSTNTNIVS